MLNQYWMISPVLEETDTDLYTDFTSWDWVGVTRQPLHGAGPLAYAFSFPSFLCSSLSLSPKSLGERGRH